MNATATYLRLISMDVTSVDPRQHRHLRTHEFTAMVTPLAARTGGPSPGKAKQLMSREVPDKSSSQLRHRHPKTTARSLAVEAVSLGLVGTKDTQQKLDMELAAARAIPIA